MQITERDLKLFRWINGLGVVSVDEVASYLSMELNTAYQRLRKLVNAGFLLHECYLYNQPGIYRVTRQGVALSEDSLSALRHVRLGVLRHDLLVAKLSLLLTKHFGAEFIPERRLRQARGIKGVGQSEHVSDGLLQLSDKTVAIEVELSLKGESRRKKILRSYCLETAINEVWYFCGNRIILKKFTEHQVLYPFLQCQLLQEYVDERSKTQV